MIEHYPSLRVGTPRRLPKSPHLLPSRWIEDCPGAGTVHLFNCLGAKELHSEASMNAVAFIRHRSFLLACGASVSMALGIGCTHVSVRTAPASFSRVQPILETNCVHCHGHEHLKGMPSFADTGELSKLIGIGNWIVPGHPERSRFLHVVTLADNQAGAMPPTGHAIAKSEIDTLREWISAGAAVPAGKPVPLIPKGPGPR